MIDLGEKPHLIDLLINSHFDMTSVNQLQKINDRYVDR